MSTDGVKGERNSSTRDTYGSWGLGRLWESKAVLYNTEIFKNFLLCLIFYFKITGTKH